MFRGLFLFRRFLDFVFGFGWVWLTKGISSLEGGLLFLLGFYDSFRVISVFVG